MNAFKRGRLGGLLGALLGLALIIASRSIPASRISGDPGSGVLPLIAGSICLISGVILLIKKPDKTDKQVYLTGKQWLKALSIVGMYLAFYLGMRVFGYIITAPIVIFCTCTILAHGKNVSVIRRIIFSLCVSGFLYVLFHVLLNVVLPKGVLGIG
ncbi:MAG: tripartite tricarboxylate transporter TctB family protein [Clostridia bacterium]|nr:tripartite tricarboxylate transporter TctB family protein [Clostridia bacterium]